MLAVRRLAGAMIAWLARIYLATLRVEIHGDGDLEKYREKPWILVFFHGTQLLLQRMARRRRTCVMVSHSKDGELQTGALSALGFDVVRGSSSRGGARALKEMVRRLTRGADAVFAVDGPRGPYGVAKPGVLLAASRSGACMVPAGAAARRGWVLDRAWDRFVLPYPFTTVHIVVGAPVDEPDELAVSRAIATCNREASALAAR